MFRGCLTPIRLEDIEQAFEDERKEMLQKNKAEIEALKLALTAAVVLATCQQIAWICDAVKMYMSASVKLYAYM